MKPTLPHWPRMLRLEFAAGYCGMSADTFEATCPVGPTDLGARILAWDRVRLDAWLDGRPQKPARRSLKRKLDSAGETAPPSPVELTPAERRARALENVRCQNTRQTS